MTTPPASVAFPTRNSHQGGLLLGMLVIVGLGILVRPTEMPLLLALRRHRVAGDLERLIDTPGAFRVTTAGVLYLQMPVTRDPWGSPYEIRPVAEGRIQVLSLGPDRCEGTPDDIRREVDLGR
jgi:hypothetical protein